MEYGIETTDQKIQVNASKRDCVMNIVSLIYTVFELLLFNNFLFKQRIYIMY